MRTKTLLIIGILFIVLLLGWGWFRWHSPDNSINNLSKLGISKQTIEAIDKIIIKRDNQQLILEKKDQQWYLDGRLVSASKVKKILTEMEDWRLEGPIAKQPASHERLGVKDGLQADYWQGEKKKFSLLIGKQAQLPASTYIRRADQNEVYVVDVYLSPYFALSSNYWWDKTVIQLKREAVKKIKFDYPEVNFELVYQDGNWQARRQGGNFAVKPEVMDGLFNNLSSLQADEIVLTDDKKNKFKQSKQVYQITFYLEGDKQLVLYLVKQNDDWLVKTNESDDIYLVPGFRLAEVVLKWEEIIPANN